jgi:predicted  nucleic acid-binding Zn-ribbon protein
MASPVPAGSDVSAGTYRCTNCGNEIQVSSQTHIPPCPSCGAGNGRPSPGETASTTPIRTASRSVTPAASTGRSGQPDDGHSCTHKPQLDGIGASSA